LEKFKTEHRDKLIKIYGSVDKFNECIEKFKSNETEIAKMAIKKYGGIEKYVEALEKNLNIMYSPKQSSLISLKRIAWKISILN